MALSYDHGAIHWLAADAATTNYVVNSMSFQPKALKFTICGLHSATDASSITANVRRGMGFATSTSNRACVGQVDQDNAATAVCGAIYRNDAVVAVVTTAGGVDGLLDLTALASNGFTLTVDDQIAADITVFWEAWGGTDVTNAEVIEFVEPGATGAVDYTLSGAFQPDVVLFTGCNLTTASPAVGRTSANWMMGWATGTGAAAQSVLAIWAEDTPTTMDTDRYHRTGQCVAAHITSGNSAITARASLSAFNSDGFELNWAEVGTANRRYLALAIKGGSWAAGSTTINGQSVSSTATVSGLSFQPKGASLFTHHLSQDADDTVFASDIAIWGNFSSTSSRRSMYTADVNGVGTSTVVLGIDYDCVLVAYSTTPALVEHVDVTAVNSDGFTLTVETADASGSTTELISYLAFGDAPAAGSAFPHHYYQQMRR